jgi:Fic family protein
MRSWQIRDGKAPRNTLLEQLVTTRTPPIAMLRALGAFHNGAASSEAMPWRSGWANAGEHVFPPPDAIDLLLAGLFGRLTALWRECKEPRDDLLVAVFAIYGVVKIHPFANGNGRSAVDLAQGLLMYRWGLTTLPWSLSENVHADIGRVLATLGRHYDGTSAEQAIALTRELGSELAGTEIEALQHNAQLVAIADWLAPVMLAAGS